MLAFFVTYYCWFPSVHIFCQGAHGNSVVAEGRRRRGPRKSEMGRT